ncbi:MAG: S46 family peptidase, partial [candidate division Zixibacteria bacterium]|nr:S46 family peptidase [candidate division KSB1 bacterium]NIR63627.1 S46 family peptidase [candidate division Zixibacteria bacterium]NIS45598.1 S46 family peptidase [candidate division Zixibacteria bacterium]NIT70866.1 S46 family peptidase [candidate division KSB1 bacterium]NIU13715.1 S46 family peptidase [candidate division Zixibacteria bacterium]
VPGNPGSTDRLYPYAYLEYQRDYRYPNLVNYIDERLSWLGEYAEKGKEQRQQAMIQIYRYQNAKKAYNGQFKGLQNEEIMEARKKGEMEFREKVRSNPELNKAYGDAWTRIEKLLAAHATRMDNHFYRQLRGSKLAYTALRIVRYVSEIKKPDSERMDGYHDAKLEGLKFKLLSPAPFYPELENVTFAGWLSLAKKNLGEDDPFIKLVLDGQTPEQVARQVIDDSKLTEVEYRKSLLEGGEEAVKSADDPLLKFVQRVDPFLREEAEWYKNTVKSVFADAETKIAKARFAVYGKSIYPDATFTLRLSYGAAKGYPMNGTRAPYKTSLYGLYDRTLSFDREGEFTLPERFWTHKEKLDLSTPVNLVSTNDVIGGNSGSPLINKAAEIVGIVFDGNIESLVGRFVYDDKTNRTVSVHSAYIIEALRKLYGARALADEIEVSQVKASRE